MSKTVAKVQARKPIVSKSKPNDHDADDQQSPRAAILARLAERAK